RYTLAAGLVTEELRDAAEDGDERLLVVEHHHDARAKRSSDLARVLEGQRHRDLVGRDEHARRAAEQHGLDPTAPANAAGLGDERVELHAERLFIEAGALHMAGQAEEPRARRPLRAGPAILRGAQRDNGQYVEQRLHVVDARGLAEHALIDR